MQGKNVNDTYIVGIRHGAYQLNYLTTGRLVKNLTFALGAQICCPPVRTNNPKFNRLSFKHSTNGHLIKQNKRSFADMACSCEKEKNCACSNKECYV